MRPYGNEVGEVWGHALSLPLDSEPWPHIEHAYQNVIDHSRLMLKAHEFFEIPDAWEVAMQRVERAKALGLPILMVLDGFNSWWGLDPGDTSNYHKFMFTPPNGWRQWTRDMCDLVQPKFLQVWNEPFHRGLRTKSYADVVYDFVRGAQQSSWRGPIIGAQSRQGLGDLHDAWEWHVKLNPDDPDALIVAWDHGLFESKHREPRVLHTLGSVAEIVEALHSNAWSERRIPKGWRHLVFHDEVGVGKTVHINSQLGYNVMTAQLGFFRDKKVPMTFLTMGGYKEDWGADGNQGWGMNTDLFNKYGQPSLGCKALYDFKGVQLPDNGNGGNGNGGNGDGDPFLVGFNKAVRFTRRVAFLESKGFTVAEIVEDRQAKRNYKRWMRKIRP